MKWYFYSLAVIFLALFAYHHVAAEDTPAPIMEILKMDIPPGTYVLKDRQCTGWGIGIGAGGYSKSTCKDICCYYKPVGNQFELDRCEECPKEEEDG